MTKETEWTLFLDETGDFASDRGVSIAGLLIQHEEGENLRRVWKSTMEAALPTIAYPPHTTDLMIPSAHLAKWMAAPADRRAAHPHAGRLADAAQRIESEPDAAPGFLALVDAWRNGASLHDVHGPLHRCDAYLRLHDPACFELLENEVDLYGLGMKGLLRKIAGDLGPERCFVIGAAEVGAPEEGGTDRYLDLLVPLFERVFAFLRTSGRERHKVWVWAESRQVRDAVTGKRVELRASDLGAAVRRAEAFPFLAPKQRPDPHVRLVPATPEGKGPDMHPGLVFADFIANRLRLAVEQNLAYERLDAAIFARTGLHARAPSRALRETGPLPSLAAEGSSRKVLLASLQGGEAPPKAAGERLWMREQAETWAAAAGGAR